MTSVFEYFMKVKCFRRFWRGILKLIDLADI